MKVVSAVLIGLCVSACNNIAGSTPPDWVGRELRPARSDIKVGALYFAREAPGSQGPANLERLCDIDLSKYKVLQAETRVADIDLSKNLEASGALDGIKNYFFNAKIDANASDAFEYKLTNVVERGITGTEAERIFNQRAYQSDCAGWRENIGGQNWAKMQILSVRMGDLVFQQKANAGGSTEVNAKIAVATPQLKASLKRSYNLAMSGKGLVFSFSPIERK